MLKNQKNISGKHIQSVNEQINWDERSPVFCFQYLIDKIYSFDPCNKDEKVTFLNTALRLSKIQWKVILGLPKGNGCESIPVSQLIALKLAPAVKDTEKLLCFRMSKKGRFYGIRFQDRLHIVGIDRNHDLT